MPEFARFSRIPAVLQCGGTLSLPQVSGKDRDSPRDSACGNRKRRPRFKNRGRRFFGRIGYDPLCLFLVVVMMVGAQGSLVLEFSGQPCFGGSTGRSLGSRDDLDAALTENRGGMNAHSARNDDLRAKVGDKVRQEAGLVSGIRNGLLFRDDAVLGSEEGKALAVAEMTGDGGAVAGDSDDHKTQILSFLCCL